MRHVALVLAALSLAGCAQQRLAQQQQSLTAAIADCQTRLPLVVGGMYNRQECIGDTRLAYGRLMYPQSLDLLQVSVSRNLRWAKMVDAGQMSLPVYESAMTQDYALLDLHTQQRAAWTRSCHKH